MALDTLFTNQDSAAGSASQQFVQDAFQDETLPASNNGSFTSNITTNPLASFFGNDDVPRYGSKTLWVKDLVLVTDRSRWVNGLPTYRVIWNENFPAAQGYFVGEPVISANPIQTALSAKYPNGSFGVVGVIRKAAFIVAGSPTLYTPQTYIDGVSANSFTEGQTANDSNVAGYQRYIVGLAQSSNSSKDIHNFSINNFNQVLGVVVYFENSTTDIDCFPGTTYADKSPLMTSAIDHVAVPTMGSSMGGVSVVYKAAGGSYLVSTQDNAFVSSVAQGNSGTNLLTVTTGQGGSFPAGSGIVVPQGTSMYVGSVQQVSTDTLTVSPTLPFGITNLIYRSWLSGPSTSINASLMQLSVSIDFRNVLGGFASLPILDPYGRFCVFGNNCGLTSNINSGASLAQHIPGVAFGTASGFLQVDGDFSAADIEIGPGTGLFQATFSVNGTPCWSKSAAFSGAIRLPVFADAGSGWNSFAFGLGSSFSTSYGIAKINLYKYANLGVSTGLLASIETRQAFTDRLAINQTLMALGTARRLYADQLGLRGLSGWVRSYSSTAAGGVQYTGSGSTCSFQVQYYGQNFAIVGTAPSGATLTIDGVGTPLSFNKTITVATEGFHTVNYTHVSGTGIIQAFDYSASHGEIRFLGHTGPISAGKESYASTLMPIHRAYTPIVTGGLGTAPTLGNNPTQQGYYTVIGNEMRGWIKIVPGSSSTAGSQYYQFSIPPGYQIDTRFVSLLSGTVSSSKGGSAKGSILGWAIASDGSNTNGLGYVQADTATTLVVTHEAQSANTATSLDDVFQFGGDGQNSVAFGTATEFYASFSFPVVGLAANRTVGFPNV